MELFRDISINIILLFGMVFVFTLPETGFDRKKPLVNAIIGMIIGVMTIMIMINAWELESGAIFDTRSVMIGATALFFPPISAIMASLIAIGYRITLGGIGVYAGSLSIAFALIIGLIWRKYVAPRAKMHPHLQFYLFGLLVHLFVVLAQFTFPYPQSLTVIMRVGPMMIIVFPLVLTLMAISLMNHQRKVDNQYLLVANEKRYRTLINSSKLGIFQYDTNGVIEITNQAFADILKTTRAQLTGLNMTTLPNQNIVACVKDSIEGIKSVYEGNYTSFLSGYEFPVRVQFSPIYEEYNVIGGIGIAEDLTEEYAQKREVELFKRKDRLTSLNNRVSFDEALFKNKDDFNYPVSLVIFDINAFQIVNTTFGYDIGNQVLKTVAEEINTVVASYPQVSVYRTGGDEFSMIAEGYSESYIDRIIGEILQQTQQIDRYDITIKLSYGYGVSNNANKPLTESFNEAVVKLLENKVYEGSSISKKTVDIIMTTLFEKSPREKIHSERVSKLAQEIAKEFNQNSQFINRVKLAARLHDIGKINISETILDKPALLTKEEYAIIKKHPGSGFKILSSVPEYSDIANIVYAHHEHYDGQGYPRGLAKKAIPLEARIVAVADAFDAMIEKRTYRKVLTVEEALVEIKAHSGTQFDPKVVEKFIATMQRRKEKTMS